MGLYDIHLAPYIQKAMILRDNKRDVGGNAFRHSMGTMDILIDYYFKDVEMDPVMLKAAVLHDLFEFYPAYNRDEIRSLDEDGPEVVRIVEILTHDKQRHPEKRDYLKYIAGTGDVRAMKVKCADRLQNLTDLHSVCRSLEKIKETLDDTEELIIPMAKFVNPYMVKELTDMVARRREEYLALSFWAKMKDVLPIKKKVTKK